MSMAASTYRHGAPRCSCAELWLEPPAAGRLHDHPAGRENFLLTNEVSFTRKIKEACWRCGSRHLLKDKDLELYLNEFISASASYASPGVAGHFDKSVNDLPSGAPNLAALPSSVIAPSVKNRDRALNGAIRDRPLLENGWIKQAEATRPARIPLIVTNRSNAAHTFGGEYLPRSRDVFERYGEKNSMKGLSYGPRWIRSCSDGAQDMAAASPMTKRRAGAVRQQLDISAIGRETRRHQIALGHLALAMAVCWRPATVRPDWFHRRELVAPSLRNANRKHHADA